MQQYHPWSRGDLKNIVRRELMDTSSKWFSDAELNLYAQNWLDEIQQQYEFVWGTCTVTTAVSTLTLSSFTPPMSRLDAIYWLGTATSGGYRLAGRLLQDLEVNHHEWRSALPDLPREVVQYDSTRLLIWPPTPYSVRVVFEYPTALSWVDDSTLCPLPIWTQYSAKPYICGKALLRPGATNDPKRALRYRKKYEQAKQMITTIWANFQPERYRKLKPMGHYERDILNPPPAMNNPTTSTLIIDQYKSYLPTPAPNGTNPDFTIPISIPGTGEVRVFLNGLLQELGVDYTRAGSVVSFTTPPNSTDLIIVWVFIPLAVTPLP